MDIKKLSGIRGMKIQCSKYSDLDDLVIKEATELGLPLIGGTALEIIAAYFKHSGVRKRSDNDIDCLSNNLGLIGAFQDWLDSHIDPNKVQVDVYTDVNPKWENYKVYLDGVLVMSPLYILWSKLIRGSDKDKQDIKWLMSIPQITDEDIVNALEDLGVTEDEIELLNSLV